MVTPQEKFYGERSTNSAKAVRFLPAFCILPDYAIDRVQPVRMQSRRVNREFLARVRLNWGEFWQVARRRNEFLISLALLTAVMLVTLKFLHYNEQRPGVRVADPLLALIPPVDLSVPTFILLYMGLIATVSLLMAQPHRLLIGIQVYAIYAGLRMLSMWLIPLEPPEGMIPLQDPLLSWAQTGKQLNKDLFFSGHTATMFIFYLIIPRSRTKSLFLLGFVVMACCLIVQRVHYSVDVLSAPFYCYGALGLVLRLRKTLRLDADLHNWLSGGEHR